MRLSVVTPPAGDPADLTLTRASARIDSTADDAVLQMLLKTAAQALENASGRALLSTVYRLTLDAWPDDDLIRLPRAPVTAVASVKYIDSTGTQQTLVAGTDYKTDLTDDETRIAPGPGKSWPTPRGDLSGIEVVFTAGFASAAAIPAALASAAIVLAVDWYDNRDRIGTMNAAALALIEPLRLARFA